MLLALWGSVAHAATLVVMLSGPGLQVSVDGAFYPGSGGTVTVQDLAAGAHTVRVVDMMSKPVLTQDVVFAANDYVVMKYKSKTLTETNRSTESDGAPVEAAEPTAPFDVVLATVRECETPAGQHDVIRLGGKLWTFSSSQLVQLMGTFDQDADKVAVARALYRKLVDPQRKDVIAAAVASDEAKAQVRDLFE